MVSERRFLGWIGKTIPDTWRRTYSADQIATLGKLSSGTVEEPAPLAAADRGKIKLLRHQRHDQPR